MQVLSNLAVRCAPITTYDSHGAAAVRIADGEGEAHAYLVRFEAGGAIGRHEAGYGQLFMVIAGAGWTSGEDGVRAEVRTGDVIVFARGEEHAKGSDTGMTAVMVQVRDLTISERGEL